MQTPTETGIYRNVPAEHYHRWKAFSITTGLELLKSPGHYYYRLNNPIEATPAMRMGTLIHMRLLEPELFKDTVVIVPEFIPRDRRTKARKEWEEACCIGPNGYLDVVESEDARTIEGIYQSVMSRKVSSALLKGEGETELSIFWREDGWLNCKGRLDRYHAPSKTLVDIKTTDDASPVQFAKTLCNRAYHVQFAQYAYGGKQVGLDIENVVVIAIEKKPPYGVGVYQIPEIAMRSGFEQRKRLIEKLHIAEQKEEWLAYPDMVQTLDFPEWAFNSIERALGYY